MPNEDIGKYALDSMHTQAWQNIYDSVSLSILKDGEEAIVNKMREYAESALNEPAHSPKGFLYLCAAYCISKAHDDVNEKRKMEEDFGL